MNRKIQVHRTIRIRYGLMAIYIDNDLEAVIDAKLFENDIGNTANKEEEIEGNLRDSRRIIISDIHSQVKVVHVNGCKYLHINRIGPADIQ